MRIVALIYYHYLSIEFYTTYLYIVIHTVFSLYIHNTMMSYFDCYKVTILYNSATLIAERDLSHLTAVSCECHLFIKYTYIKIKKKRAFDYRRSMYNDNAGLCIRFSDPFSINRKDPIDNSRSSNYQSHLLYEI